MTSIKDKPSASEPEEGSREVIERELQRKGREKEADRNRENARPSAGKARESKERQSK